MIPTAIPQVSVVIPLYNRAATIRRAVESVVAQTFGDWELLVVDDGSDDDGVEVVEAFADPRIRVVRHTVNRGAAAARNTGVAESRAPLLAFLDSDDTWMPDKLAIQVAAMRDRPDIDGLTLGFALIRLADGRRQVRRPRDGAARLPALLDGCHVSPGSTLMVRRASWDAAGPQDEGLRRFEDWDWLLRATETCRIGSLPDIGATVLVGPQPDLARTRDAVAALGLRQGDRVRRLARSSGLRRFLASLAVERVAAAVRDRSWGAALREAGTAITLSPSRALGEALRWMGNRRG